MSENINVGKLSEILNNKEDRNLRNTDTGSGADAVISYQIPTAENGYTWYRKYASGWVEQGGNIPRYNSDQKITVSLPVTMADTNYFISRDSINLSTSGTTDPYWHGAYSLAVDSFDCYVSNTGGTYYRWEVKGVAASI